MKLAVPRLLAIGVSAALLSLSTMFTATTALAQAAPSDSPAAGLTAVDGIAAVIDEDVILRTELDRAVANVLTQYAGQAGQLPPREILEKQVLERLIMMRLQLARAADTGVRIADAELAQAIQGVAAQNKLSADQLRERLASEGISYDEFRNGLREEITVQRLRQRLVQSRVQVSETEIDQLLALKEVGGSEVHLANLLVALPDGATPEQIATAQKKIEGIKDLLDKGELDFAAAAIRYSDAQNALDGGDIGWRGLDAIPPAFVNMVKGMKPGEVTPPVRGASGYQLVKLIETRDASAQKITQYNALGILIRITDLLPTEVARQKAQDLHDLIAKGEDFAKLAREHSDDSMNRGQGGDMGWFAVNDWGNSIGSQIQQLADGQLSPVFQSDVGFHIIKRVGSREQDVSDQNRRNQARELIAQRKAEEEYERFLRQLRSDAFVEPRLGKN